MESSNLPDSLKARPAPRPDKANHTDSIKDWGFDVGGPILKDRLWFGVDAKNDIKIVRLNQTFDRDDPRRTPTPR
jgi:hypothetical protein